MGVWGYGGDGGMGGMRAGGGGGRRFYNQPYCGRKGEIRKSRHFMKPFLNQQAGGYEVGESGLLGA